MTFLSKITLFVFLFCLPVIALAKAPVDTNLKKIKILTPKLTATDQVSEFLAYIKDALIDMRQDSMASGIHLLNVGLSHATATKMIAKVADYRTSEVFWLLAVTDTGKLSPEEKQLGQTILKAAFIKSQDINEATFNDLLKRAPNTRFTQRLKLFLLSYSDKKRAVALLNEVLKQQPNLISANMLKAEILNDDEKYDDAIVYSSKVISFWPDYAHAYDIRGQAYANNKHPENALSDYDAAIRIFPAYFPYDYERADALMDMDKYREAIISYMKVLKWRRNYKWTNYSLARCYKALEMPDSAHYYIDIHIRYNPEDGDGYNIKGDIYYQQNNYPMAIEQHSKAINLNQGKARFYEDRGDDYYYADQTDEAIKDYEKGLSIDKANAYVNDRLGDCYRQKKDYEKAIPYHQKALKIDPNYKYAYLGLYYCYSSQNKSQQAIYACQKAIAIDSTYASALGNLGWQYYLTGDYEACIAYSQKAIKYDEESTYAMFNIGLATLRKGDNEKAKSIYQNYRSLCLNKGYKINAGSTNDLRDLVKNNIMVKEATYIIETIFGEK